MTVEEKVLETLRELSPEKQQVLKFVESLKQDNGPRKPLRSLEGI